MTPKIRIGTDITVNWSFIRRDDTPYSLLNSELTVVLITPRGKAEILNHIVSGNTLSWTFLGNRQGLKGDYSLRITINDGTDGSEYTLDLLNVFRLVGRTENQNWDGGTIDKTSRVLTLTEGTGSSVIDTELSETSGNAVQNKAITAALKRRPTNTEVANIIAEYVSKNAVKGADGVSPTVTLKTDSNGVTITVKDVNGTSSARILNGNGSSSGVTASELATALAKKQDKLVSGTNIKTVNGLSLLGSGNIAIEGGSGSSGVTVFRYSDWTSDDSTEYPATPTVNESIWHTIRHDSDTWLAIGTTADEGGYNWALVKLTADSTSDRTVTKTDVSYGISNSALDVPSSWTTDDTTIKGYSGQYFWTRTEYTFSDGTTEVIVVPTYLATNGNDGNTPYIKDGYWYINGVNQGIKAVGTDGANGTSVTIKGELSSMSSLPSSGASAGDSYVIGGDLWVYTGTSTTDSTHYNGFTNCGTIKGDAGLPAYIHVAWANSSNGYTDFTNSNPSGNAYAYMGTYTDNTLEDSDVYTDYQWVKVAGKDGADGVQGPKGADGSSTYVHVAWMNTSNNSDGSFTTSNPSGKAYNYIGIYTDTTEADSTSPSKYKWSYIRGEEGATGTKGEAGADGYVACTHVAWSNSADGTTDFAVGKQAGASYKYMGIYVHYVETLEAAENDADPTDPTVYSWVEVKGDKPTVTVSDDGYWVIDGVKTTTKVSGEKGASLIYAGEYDPDNQTIKYYGKSTCCNIVYYDGKYWMASPTSSDVDEYGAFWGYQHIPGVSGNWIKFGTSFDNIATGLVWTDNLISTTIQALNASINNADITNLVVKQLQTADSGARVETEGNVLYSYDAAGNRIVAITGEEITPDATTLELTSDSVSLTTSDSSSSGYIITDEVAFTDSTKGKSKVMFHMPAFPLIISQPSSNTVPTQSILFEMEVEAGGSYDYIPFSKSIKLSELEPAYDTGTTRSYRIMIDEVYADISDAFTESNGYSVTDLTVSFALSLSATNTGIIFGVDTGYAPDIYNMDDMAIISSKGIYYRHEGLIFHVNPSSSLPRVSLTSGNNNVTISNTTMVLSRVDTTVNGDGVTRHSRVSIEDGNIQMGVGYSDEGDNGLGVDEIGAYYMTMGTKNYFNN